MSEYQYYEFQAVDRPLTRDEQEELRSLSSRAEITARSFTNTYNYGDFRGDPATLMDRYFDAFVYVSNWGSRQLMLRVPASLLDADVVIPFTDDEFLTVRTKGKNTILEFSSQPEDWDGDWVDGEGWMDSLIGLRDELMRGDLRALYLGWLASFEARGWFLGNSGDHDEPVADEADEVEPPVPPGLGQLSESLKSLAEFFSIDTHLIAAAATGNNGPVASGPSPDELARWIKSLPASAKDGFLLRLLNGEGDLSLRAELTRNFRVASKQPETRPGSPRRSATQLLVAQGELEKEAERREAARREQEWVRQVQVKAQEQAKRLDDLIFREVATWREVDTLIATKLPKNYDKAVELLIDLVALAQRKGRSGEATAKIKAIRQQHSAKHSFLKRLDGRDLGR